jgi:predicted TIM-barrel fold metal-dependent hydrolase
MGLARMLGLVVALSLLLAGPSANAQQALPIIDLHFHPLRGWDMAALVDLFDELGVAKAGNGPGGPDEIAFSFAAKYPDRFIPFAGLGEITFHIQREGELAWTLQGPGIMGYLSKLEGELRSGAAKGIGELFPDNMNSHPDYFPGMRYPADSPLMRRLWALSAQYGVPLSVHLEARGAPIAEMERLLEVTPRGTFIWAHTGFFAEPPLLRRLLQQHPALFCELSWRDERALAQGWRLPIPISEGNQLKTEWKDLLEEFSDRFVIGTDVSTPSPIEYARLVKYWRAILSQLTPETAEKFAHANAERILRLPSLKK